MLSIVAPISREYMTVCPLCTASCQAPSPLPHFQFIMGYDFQTDYGEFHFCLHIYHFKVEIRAGLLLSAPQAKGLLETLF